MDSFKPELRVFEGIGEVAAAAAGEFRARGFDACKDRRSFTCALSGGTTPQSMFRELAGQSREGLFPLGFWNNTHIFWGDERDVPPDNAASNYRAAREALLDHIDIPAGNIHRMAPERGGAIAAAEEYEAELKAFFSLGKGATPQIDLFFLGIGEDGHTASIFPSSDVLYENTRLVFAPWVGKLNAFRITLTPRVINNSLCSIFMVTGAEKAETVRQVLEGPYMPERFPAQIVRPKSGRLIWLLDRAAASQLSHTSNS
jgi:6-phosphogluconolactonase